MKKLLGLGIMLLAINLIIVSCAKNEETKNVFKKQSNADALNFKNEYEDLNTKKNENNELIFQTLNIDDDNLIVYLNYDEVLEFLKNGTGVLYFGRPACPWSRNFIDTLLDFSWYNKENIYYYNIEEIRDENNDEYKQLLEILGEFLPVDTVTQKLESKKFDKNLKRITLPYIFFLKDGKIKDYYNGFQENNLKNNNYNQIDKRLNEAYELIK